jgi:hypothetical protein
VVPEHTRKGMIDAIDAQIAPLEDANHLALSGRRP